MLWIMGSPMRGRKNKMKNLLLGGDESWEW